MRFKQIVENSTTAGSVATVAKPMMTQTRENTNVRGLKPVQQVMKGAKKKGPYSNSIVESKVTEDDLAEQDLIVIPGQGRLRRTGFVKHDMDQGEHEGHTLKNSLHTIARAASDLDKRLSMQSEFPEWVSEKIGAAKGMMVTVMDYLISSQEMQHDPDAMEGVAEGMGGQTVFTGTGADGGKYEVIQTGPTDFMIHANDKHIDTYSSLARAMSVLKNEVPGLETSVAEAGDTAKGQKMLAKVHNRAADRVTSKQADKDPAYARKAQQTQDRAWDRLAVKEQGVAEGSKKIPASNKPVDPKDLVVSLKDVPVKKPRGHKQYDPANEFPGVKAFKKQGVAEGQLDELSRDTLNAYLRKSKNRADDFHAQGEKASMEPGRKAMAKGDKYFDKRDNVLSARRGARDRMKGVFHPKEAPYGAKKADDSDEIQGVAEAAKGILHRVRYQCDDPSGAGIASGHITLHAPDKATAARYAASDLSKKGKKNVKVLAVTPQKQGVEEGSIKDIEAKIRTHDQRKADREQAGDPYVAHEIHSHNVIRKQLLDKRKRAQAEYHKKMDSEGVAEGIDAAWDAAKAKVNEGAKVDRMVKHVKKSEKKLGHSDKEAENIAWATANKRGMLDNKNKKK